MVAEYHGDDNVTAIISNVTWDDLEPVVHWYTDYSGHTLKPGYEDTSRRQLFGSVIFSFNEVVGKGDYSLDDNHWFFGHDDRFHYWSRIAADTLWSFGSSSFDIAYAAIPTSANQIRVRPTMVYSGVGELYFCTSVYMHETGFVCKGVAVGNPFVGWRELPMPIDTLLFAKPISATSDKASFVGIVQSGIMLAKSLWRIDYTISKSEGDWKYLCDIPTEDTNVSMWDITIFGDTLAATNMRKILFNNVFSEQSLISTNGDTTGTTFLQPWPEPINASYP